jgi:hypothetical protein
MRHHGCESVTTSARTRSTLAWHGLAMNALVALIFLLIGDSAIAAPEPAYQTIVKDGDFEIRDYPALIAAEVHVSGEREEAGNAAFRLLAGYIFGGNTQRREIEMTAPVAMSRDAGEKIRMTAPVAMSGSPDKWAMQFFMPPEYTLETLPVPDDPRVKLVPVPPTRYAVVRFSGIGREDAVAENTERLRAFIANRHLLPIGPAILSRYNPPWTLWFLRRNEIWFQIQHKPQ